MNIFLINAIVREGNKIQSVYDVSDDLRIGEVAQIPSGDYPGAMEYDANGNRTRDDLRGITTVTYHQVTDLPSVMKFADGAKLQWNYRSDGTLTKFVTTSNPIRYIASIKENGDTVWRTRSVTNIYSHIGDFIRTNTNRWRLYHEAGHSDIDAMGAVSHRYYIRDYLGSTRVVLDGAGQMLQTTGYYPSGLPYAITSGEAETDRLHTGKQFIDHNGAGLHDNGARLLDGILCEFTSPDPLSEKYPSLSHYVHCADNPLSYIDPDGRDIWRIDDRGHIIEHLETTDVDKFIMVNELNKALVDHDGNEISVSFPYGTVIGQTSHSEPGEYDVYTIRGDDNGKQLFEFMSQHISGSESQVEIGLFQTGYSGDRGRNYITTGHVKGSEPGLTYLYGTELQRGYSVRTVTHSHPVSDYSSDSDEKFRDQIKKNQIRNKIRYPNFFIYHVPTRNYVNY